MGVALTAANRHGLVEIRAADVAGAVRLCLRRNLRVTGTASDNRRHIARIRVRVVCDQAGVDDVRPCGSGCAVKINIGGLVVRVGCVRPVWRRAQRVESLVNVDMTADKQVCK